MDKISLKGMRFYGHHGVFPEENQLGQRFIVDADLYLDLSRAAATDELLETINYADVAETVREIVEGVPFRLIETLTERIISAILEKYILVQEITVRVIKPDPPFAVHFEGVTVEMHRKRE